MGGTLVSHTLFLRRNSSSGTRLSSVFSFLEAGSSSMGGGGWTGGIGAGAGTGATGGAGTNAARTGISSCMSGRALGLRAGEGRLQRFPTSPSHSWEGSLLAESGSQQDPWQGDLGDCPDWSAGDWQQGQD